MLNNVENLRKLNDTKLNMRAFPVVATCMDYPMTVHVDESGLLK